MSFNKKNEPKPFQFIWDPESFRKCTKIPEEEATLDQLRQSAGLEINPFTGERFRLIPEN